MRARRDVDSTILVRGDAGIGKTRFVEQTAGMAREAGFEAHLGLVLDFGTGQGRAAVPALVRSMLGLKATADTSEREQALAGDLAAELGAEAEVHLCDLLDLPLDSEQRAVLDAMPLPVRRRARRTALCRLVEAKARRRPQLLIVEDLHWAEAETLDDLAAVIGGAEALPLVVLLTTRIEGDPLGADPRERMFEASCLTIDLGPLTSAEARSLARAVVGGADVVDRAIDRAGGNPLFLEQLLRHAAGADTELPATIRSLVVARLDRLAALDREALRAAGVLGQRFSLDAVRAIIDHNAYTADLLIDRGLIQPYGEEFLFRHALIRDACYASLLKSERRALHKRAATWFTDRDLDLHALHLDLAQDETAAGAYLEAARLQLRQFHFERARQHASRGLELATDPGQRAALGLLLGEVLHDIGQVEPSIAAYQQVLEGAPDGTQTCRALIGLAAGMRLVDRLDEALAVLDRAEALATDESLILEAGRAAHLRGNIYFPLGRLDGCLGEHRRALAAARAASSLELEAAAQGGIGDGEYARGRMRSAHVAFGRCVELANAQGLGRIAVANLSMVAYTAIFLAEFDSALDIGRRAVSLAGQVEHARAEIIAHNAILNALLLRGLPLEARANNERCLELARQLGSRRFEGQGLVDQAMLVAATGDRPAAVVQLRAAIAVIRASGLGFFGPWALGALAVVTQDADERAQALDEGEALLGAGSIGHNHFFFRRHAIEACAAVAAWAEVERHAEALAAYSRAEPLPLFEAWIALGRGAAALGRRPGDPAAAAAWQGAKAAVAAIPAACQAAAKIDAALGVP